MELVVPIRRGIMRLREVLHEPGMGVVDSLLMLAVVTGNPDLRRVARKLGRDDLSSEYVLDPRLIPDVTVEVVRVLVRDLVTT